jgi:hypothetical protein
MISSIESVAMYIQLQPRRSQTFDGRSEKVRVWSGCTRTRCKRGSEGLHTQGMLVDRGSWDATPTGYGGAHEQ